MGLSLRNYEFSPEVILFIISGSGAWDGQDGSMWQTVVFWETPRFVFPVSSPTPRAVKKLEKKGPRGLKIG